MQNYENIFFIESKIKVVDIFGITCPVFIIHAQPVSLTLRVDMK